MYSNYTENGFFGQPRLILVVPNSELTIKDAAQVSMVYGIPRSGNRVFIDQISASGANTTISATNSSTPKKAARVFILYSLNDVHSIAKDGFCVNHKKWAKNSPFFKWLAVANLVTVTKLLVSPLSVQLLQLSRILRISAG
jgi:hypothetical protein